MNSKDESLIPNGPFCYRLVEIEEGEVLSRDIERCGIDLREFPYRPGWKQVACPYYARTNYGTVKCNFVGMEARDDRERINAHFNDDNAADRYPWSWQLSDEIKVCGINEEEDEPFFGTNDSPVERDQSSRATGLLARAAKGAEDGHFMDLADPRVPAKVREHAATFGRPARLVTFVRDGEYVIHAANGEILDVMVLK